MIFSNYMKKGRQYITLNAGDKHLQKFSFRKLEKMFSGLGLQIVARQNGPVFGGPITERSFSKLPGFKYFSNKLADLLPSCCALA